MNDTPNITPSPQPEFRIKRGDKIRSLIAQFPPTEKAIFLILVAVALIAALTMAYEANDYFLVTVPAQGGSLTEGEIGLPRTANPVMAFTDADQDVISLVYSGLLRRDASGDLIPDLASAYSVSPDGLTYDFILRDGAKFDDGQPITADDVVFTVQKTQDIALKSPYRADWADVTVKKVSDKEVQFILKEPYAPFIENATLGIMPEHIWKNVSDDQFIFSAYNVQPVGDGPYRVASVAKDSDGVPQSYTLVPSPTYLGARPYISSIVLKFYPDEAHAFQALEAGDVESVASLDPADAAILASTTPSERILTTPLPRLFGVFFNQNQNPVFADAAVRQALSLAIDRPAVVRKVLDGYGTPISGPVPPGILASTTPVPPAEASTSRALLAKDGWTLGSDGVYQKTVSKKAERLAFTITTGDSPDLTAAANLIAAEWNALGADVTVNVFEYGDLENAIAGRTYDSLFFGEYVGNGLDLYAFWHSSQRNAPGLNIAEYVSNPADRVLAAARSATSSDQAAADLSAFQGIFAQDVPAAFVYAPDFIYALPDKVQSADVSSVLQPSDRWNGVADWYIQTDRVWGFITRLGLGGARQTGND